MLTPIYSDEFVYTVTVDRYVERITSATSVSEETIQWLDVVGICAPASNKAKYFRAIEPGPFACLAWPDAPYAHHRIISDVLCLVAAIDDIQDGDSELWNGDCSVAELLAVLPRYLASGDSAVFPSQRPLYNAISDVRNRLECLGAPASWMKRFGGSIAQWLGGVEQERSLKDNARVPGLEELLRIRVSSGAVNVFSNFIETSYGAYLDAAQLNDPGLVALRHLVARIAVYPNDLLSYTREEQYGHVMNVLTVLRHHEDLPLERAMRHLVEMHNDDTGALHALADQLLANSKHDVISSYVQKMQTFVHGLFLWGLYSARYLHDLLVPVDGYADSLETTFPGVPTSIDDTRDDLDSDGVIVL